MPLLREATNEMAYAKIGLLGFAGGGKTRTATEIAIGLHRYIKSDKPVAFLDTETGSDFMLARFKEAGVKVLVAKSRSFKDLLAFMVEAQGSCDIAIIDSLTHFWEDLINSYCAKKRIDRMEFQHWKDVKLTWKGDHQNAGFSSTFVQAPMHVIVCGRAGYEYSYEENDQGKKELMKTGIKMKSESEFGYEPSLVIEMERVALNQETTTKRRGGTTGRQFANRAWILKDRTDLLDGRFFDNPSFETFLPHFTEINLGGIHRAIDNVSHTEEMFESNTGRTDWQQEMQKREKYIGEIFNRLTIAYPGQTAAEKKARIETLLAIFNATTEETLHDISSDVLQGGFNRLCGYVKIIEKLQAAGIATIAAAAEKLGVPVEAFTESLDSQIEIIRRLKGEKTNDN